MRDEQAVQFPCGPLSLEGRLFAPAQATAACVICHPHPLYGGDMHSNVVMALAQHLGAAGLATLRFNFRGVGGSSGAHDGGAGEVDDARAAAGYLASTCGLPRVAIAGYSFGSVIALRLAAADPGIESVIAVAPPLAMFDASFVAGASKPMLLAAGDRDAYCPRAAIEELHARAGGQSRLLVLSGADHFLVGREGELGRAATDFLLGSG